ncbi:MAG TPA: hypothetical protein VEF72_16665 [Mycobacterium sp.]|nr:hypothetical protein [Mycobacterium sp.]
MRLRRRRFRATVSGNETGAYPIVLGFGPAISFEAGIDEAHALAVELVDAIELA